MITVKSTTTNNTTLQCKAMLEYIGDDQNIREYFKGMYSPEKDDSSVIAYVTIRFDTELSEFSFSYERDYSTRTRRRKIRLPTSRYHGYLFAFYNYASKHSLYQQFPVLQKTKGISYVLLLCCICEALKLGFITPESDIMLEASGSIAGQPMDNLVRYYEQLGFSVIYPQYLEIGLENQFVPMKAQVQRFISLCTVDRVSPEMLNLLPVRMCKGMCGL